VPFDHPEKSEDLPRLIVVASSRNLLDALTIACLMPEHAQR
jgi:hypothetical protein